MLVFVAWATMLAPSSLQSTALEIGAGTIHLGKITSFTWEDHFPGEKSHRGDPTTIECPKVGLFRANTCIKLMIRRSAAV